MHAINQHNNQVFSVSVVDNILKNKMLQGSRMFFRVIYRTVQILSYSI